MSSVKYPCCSTALPSKFCKYCFIKFLLLHFRNIQPDDGCLVQPKHVDISDYYNKGGPGSSDGIATDYGLDGPGSNPGGKEIFHPSRSALGTHPASCEMGTGSFPGVKCGRGVLLTTHPPSSAAVTEE